MGHPLPKGVVTFVLGDLEGSVGMWERDGAAMTVAMARADELVDGVAAQFGAGRPAEQGEGDNFMLVFERVSDAVGGACELQRRFAAEAWPGDLELRFRVGVHTGEAALDATNRYEGSTINRCARIRDLAHGGQTLLSEATSALAADVMPSGVTVCRLGPHRLRGMDRLEGIHQLCHRDLRDDFPPVPSGVGDRLPSPVSRFVGRSDELAEVGELLKSSRIVTIAGAGGSGKSRLALEIARSWRGGSSAWLTELASLQDSSLVTRAVAEAVGVEVAGGGSRIDAIIRAISGRPALLVIDNCEHLIDACAEVVASLATACPDLSTLTTSREPLGVTGEITWRIPSLAAPDALVLFADRARRVNSSFDLDAAGRATVESICARVDRLPLAIELAAARCRTMSVGEVSDGLRERFRLLTGGSRDALPRQRSLEASVAWSYGLLGEAEQIVLARLSVFATSFDLEGAAFVVDAPPVAPEHVREIVTTLVDRSLLQVESDQHRTRYRMLETVRVFARDRLAELDDPDTVRHRHLEFALQLARTGGAGFAVDAARWDPILRTELDNVRAAIEWAAASGRAEEVIDLVENLSGFWQARGQQYDIDRALRSVIFSETISPAQRARGTAAAVTMAGFSGDLSTAFDFAEDCYRLAAEIGETDLETTAAAMRAWMGMASARGTNVQIAADLDRALAGVDDLESPAASSVLLMIGSAQTWWSRLDDARATLERARTVAPQDGFEAKLAATWHLLNTGAEGRVRVFRDNAEWAIQSTRDLASDLFQTWSLQLVAFFEALYGNEERARQHLNEAYEVPSAGALMDYFVLRADAMVSLRFGPAPLALAKAQGAYDLSHEMRLGLNERIDEWLLGTAARRTREPDLARQHLTDAIERAQDPAVPFAAGRAHLDLALLDLDEEDIDAAWKHAHDALELLATSGDRTGVLDALEVLGSVAAASDTAHLAGRLLGATDALRRELEIAPFIMTTDRRGSVDQRLAAELDDITMHRSAGPKLGLDDAIAYAQRGRGARNRPTRGWQSLTPTELRVVELVADGLKNAQIAEQLLISVNTVKAHLSHVYAKLDLSSRTQLASEAATRLKRP